METRRELGPGGHRARRLVAGGIVGLVLAASVAVASPTLAQIDDRGPELPEPAMRPGTWLGSGSVVGQASLEDEGAILAMTIDLDGGFFIDVRGPEDISGEWDIIPTSRSEIDFLFPDNRYANFKATYSGTGPIIGNATSFDVVMLVEQKGTFWVEGSAYAANISDELFIPNFVKVRRAFCNEVYGDWTAAWEAKFEEYYWTPNFDGNWVAVRQTPEFETGIDDGQEPDELVRGLNQVLDDWDALSAELFGGDWGAPLGADEWGRIATILDRLDAWLNQIRNLTPCEKTNFAAGQLEYFETSLRDAIASLTDLALASPDVSAEAADDLVDLGLRSGTTQPSFDEATNEGFRIVIERALDDVVEVADDGGKPTITWDEIDAALVEVAARLAQKLGLEELRLPSSELPVPVSSLIERFGG